jgi:light-regulated signal transduction histidine kinase (bacteriophytochrome)
VDLSAIAKETIETLSAEHPERSVRVRIEPGLAVRGSATLLRAVMENLLSNSWKFTARAVDAEISFGQRVRGDAPMFFVRDNGAGFSMEYADQLFRAFRRLHDEDEFPGTGIGLVTVQRIVQRYGGRIEVESSVGEGACFYFSIPDRGDGEAA